MCAKVGKACYVKRQYCSKIPEACFSFSLQTQESSLGSKGMKKKEKRKTEFLLNIHQSKGLRGSKLSLRIRRNSLRPSVLSCTCTPSRLTLWRAKVSLLAEKKATMGCSSELLDNCVCILLYEGYLVNHKICVWNSCQNGNVKITWTKLNKYS